jgi:tRNA-2-methylthio-N6-dimethylallyladenosine synthase
MTERFVPADVAGDRFQRLRVVVERSALRKHEARVGRVEEVVVEGPSKRDPSVLSGRTRQNKLLHFASSDLPVGTLALVRVSRAAPHHLSGELVEVVERPARRARIPVVAV